VEAANRSEPAVGSAGTLSAVQGGGVPSRPVPGLSNLLVWNAPRIAACSEVGLDAAAFLFLPLLLLVPRGMAALASVAGLCAACLVLSTKRKELSPALSLAATLLGGLLLWGAISAWWSVAPLRSLAVAGRLAGLFAAGLALAAAAGCLAAPRRLTFCLLAGLTSGIVIVLSELATGGALSSLFSDRLFQLTRLNQGSMTFAILLLPASVGLAALGHPVLAVFLAVATAATIWALVGTAAKAAVLVGLPIGLLYYRSCARLANVAAFVTVVAIISAPLTLSRLERLPGLGEKADTFKISAGHRLLIWSFAGDRIAEHALLGWGLDSSRAIPGGADPIRPRESWMPLHPHNAALQLWLELGVPGPVLFALLIALAWQALARAPWPRRFAAAAAASLTIGLVGCFATYGIWQEWWLGTLWFSLFLVLATARVTSAQAAGSGLRRAEIPRSACREAAYSTTRSTQVRRGRL
jgi:O-antigen ligase